MSTHTPGPWTVKTDPPVRWPDGGGVSGMVSIEPIHFTRNVMPGDARPQFADELANAERDMGVAQANARLIVAAPDLLAACVEARDELWHHTQGSRDYAVQETLKKLDAVIKAAKGGA